MAFDFDSTLKEMVLAVEDSIQKERTDTGSVVRLFLEANRKRYEKLIDYRLTGKIDELNFQSRIADERLMLEAQLNTLSIISKVKVQNAANAAFKVLELAVKNFLKVV